MAHHILIVDDDVRVSDSLRRVIEMRGYIVHTADGGQAALDYLSRRHVDLLLLDISMPGMSGLEVLQALRTLGDETPTLMMSGEGTIGIAVQALRLGAIDFLEKPIRSERLMVCLDNCLALTRMAHVQAHMQEERHSRMVGDSPAMRKLNRTIDRTAPNELPVLILGENGTGKELVAQALHLRSGRKGPFVKLNCAAIPADLIESELFGHEAGAFTGASRQRKGRFELANGGTLLLDEIGDMPPMMQAKVLRVLQEGEFERVGGSRTLSVSVRVLSATNRDLWAMVERGAFRRDLYYRLEVLTIHTPPLRERREDIPDLVAHFAKELRGARRSLRFDGSALQLLQQQDYPGNVRELHNLVERIGILSDGDVVREGDVLACLPRRLSGRPPQPSPFPSSTIHNAPTNGSPSPQDDRAAVERALSQAGGRKAEAARILGISRTTLWRKMRSYDLN